MDISIVMSTYNGSKYIIPQLESLRLQECVADEVIIVDDCSSDNTFEIVEQYIKEHKLEGWSITKNPQNYGWKKSFAMALPKANGKYVFPADQDDVWKPDKLKVMVEVMETHPDCLLLASKNTEIYFDQIPDNNERNDSDTKIVTKVEFNNNWYYIRRPGCVFCCRREIVSLIPEIWYEDYAHDVLLWHLAVINSGLYLIDYCSIFFRRHDANATPKNIHNNTVRKRNAKFAYTQTDRLIKAIEENKITINIDENKYNIMQEYFIFGKKRLELLNDKKLSNWIWLFSKRKYYFSGIKSWMQDLICTFKLN